MIEVYRKVNELENIVCSISEKGVTYKSAIMGVEEIQCSIVVDSELDIQTGDYVKYKNINYTLNRDDEFTQKSDVEWVYDLIFEHPLYTLLDKIITLSTTGSISFGLTGKLIDFVNLVVWSVNLSATNPLGVDTGWTAGLAPDTDYKTLTFDNTSCRDVLTMLSSTYNVEFYLSNKKINYVTRIENTTGLTFVQGRGLGLYEVTKQNVDKSDTITRIYPVGGNKNVPNAYADEAGYLKLPEKYIQNTTEISRIVEKRVIFEDIFPHFIGSIESVSGTNNNEFICQAIDFNLEEIAIGTEARINFLTGDFMGYSFEFKWNNSLKKITLVSQTDENALSDSDGNKPTIPSATKKVSIGDTFNFTGVNMPETYVTASITKLRTTATDWLAFYSRKRIKFSIVIDERWMRGKNDLSVGDTITIEIPKKNISVLLRITELEKNLYTGKITATVSNYLEEKWEKKIEASITALTTSVSTGITKSTSLAVQLLADDYLKKAIADGSAEFNGGLELLNILILKGLDGVVRGGISGLYDDPVGWWTGGTYPDALSALAKSIFYKDGSFQLGGGSFRGDAAGNIITDMAVKAREGYLGNFTIFEKAIINDSIEFSDTEIEPLDSLINPVEETVNRTSAWTANGLQYATAVTGTLTTSKAGLVDFQVFANVQGGRNTEIAYPPQPSGLTGHATDITLNVWISDENNNTIFSDKSICGDNGCINKEYSIVLNKGNFVFHALAEHILADQSAYVEIIGNYNTPTTGGFALLGNTDKIGLYRPANNTKIGTDGLYSELDALRYLYYKATSGLKLKGARRFFNDSYRGYVYTNNAEPIINNIGNYNSFILEKYSNDSVQRTVHFPTPAELETGTDNFWLRVVVGTGGGSIKLESKTGAQMYNEDGNTRNYVGMTHGDVIEFQAILYGTEMRYYITNFNGSDIH